MKRVVFIILCTTVVTNTALKCYSCSASQSDLDQRCITEPENVQIGSAVIDCSRTYCTSVRVEYLEQSDIVQSMVRTCTDNPTNINEIIEEGDYRIYYKACQQDLCNGGNGRSITGSNTKTNIGVLTNLLVPGIGSATNTQSLTAMVLISICLCVKNIYL